MRRALAFLCFGVCSAGAFVFAQTPPGPKHPYYFQGFAPDRTLLMPRANRANVFVRHLRIESEWYQTASHSCSAIIGRCPLLFGEPNSPVAGLTPSTNRRCRAGPASLAHGLLSQHGVTGQPFVTRHRHDGGDGRISPCPGLNRRPASRIASVAVAPVTLETEHVGKSTAHVLVLEFSSRVSAVFRGCRPLSDVSQIVRQRAHDRHFPVRRGGRDDDPGAV
jgi:hypothetical protein